MSKPGASSPALRRIEIEDFGLIARADVDFAAGLSVFSGETGSGKTMLLGALGFVVGERSSPDMVRGGAARARVTLEVDPDEPLRQAFSEAGFEVEPGEGHVDPWVGVAVVVRQGERIEPAAEIGVVRPGWIPRGKEGRRRKGTGGLGR